MNWYPTDLHLRGPAKIRRTDGFFNYQNRTYCILPLYCIEDLSLSFVGSVNYVDPYSVRILLQVS